MVTQIKGVHLGLTTMSQLSKVGLVGLPLFSLRVLAGKGTRPLFGLVAPLPGELCHILCAQVSQGCVPLCTSKWTVVVLSPSLGYDDGKSELRDMKGTGTQESRTVAGADGEPCRRRWWGGGASLCSLPGPGTGQC